ncbi:MAG: hypothetical protein QXR11_03325, partial [Zestosphaera sp.]
MKNKLRSLTKKKSFKIILVLLLIMTVLYLLPVSPVGEPVESLALEYSKFVSVEGVRVHYVEVPGKGNMTFVLLHGF